MAASKFRGKGHFVVLAFFLHRSVVGFTIKNLKSLSQYVVQLVNNAPLYIIF